MTASIVVKNLTRKYGSFTAVDQVSFEAERGEIFGYLGANGAGKTTTIRMLCGLVPPTSGDASITGFSIGRQPQQVKQAIGYMSQKFSLYPELRVGGNLGFFGGAYGLWGRGLRTRIDEVLELVDLTGHEGDRTSDLPGGMRQRVALAGAILHEPAVVFLDEPTAGVDPVARRRFWSLIRRLSAEGTTIFVTTHYMDEAEYCARVGLMVAGRLPALDTPAGLKATYVPGKVWSLQAPSMPPDARQRLRGVAGVTEVQSMGAGWRVRTDDGVQGAVLAASLGPEAVATLDAATLEDVFLAVVNADAQRAGTQRALGAT